MHCKRYFRVSVMRLGWPCPLPLSAHWQTYRYAFYKFNPFVVNAGVDTLPGNGGNVTGEDTIFDTEGDNLIVLSTATGLGTAGLATSTFTNSDGGTSLQLDIGLDSGETLAIQSAFFGNQSTIQFANGDALDLETLVGENLATPLDLTNGSGGGRLYGGAAEQLWKQAA